jgi:hypothetical protein
MPTSLGNNKQNDKDGEGLGMLWFAALTMVLVLAIAGFLALPVCRRAANPSVAPTDKKLYPVVNCHEDVPNSSLSAYGQPSCRRRASTPGTFILILAPNDWAHSAGRFNPYEGESHESQF